MTYGPTLQVDVGFDPNYKPTPTDIPVADITNVDALVDTGATTSCIDAQLAAQLNLPIVNRRLVGGIGGIHEFNMHLAQVHVPALSFTIYGSFVGVHLADGGQAHRALIGRSFLSAFTMVYEGKTGTVTISS